MTPQSQERLSNILEKEYRQICLLTPNVPMDKISVWDKLTQAISSAGFIHRDEVRVDTKKIIEVIFQLGDGGAWMDKDGRYFIKATNGEIYQVVDRLAHFFFRSADVYSDLEIGKTYKIKYMGWRFALLSIYKSIYWIDKQD